MTIVNKNPDMVEFEKLSCGTVFKDEHANYCMKTVFNDNANIVYLSDGDLGYMEGYEKVERVRCELVVSN